MNCSNYNRSHQRSKCTVIKNHNQVNIISYSDPSNFSSKYSISISTYAMLDGLQVKIKWTHFMDKFNAKNPNDIFSNKNI